jgi:amino acid transporter
MPSYVLYGFDTAGTLAEETRDPRRKAPWAILRCLAAAGFAGGLLIIAGLLAATDPWEAELGRITGGLPLIVNEVLGPHLGRAFLVVVILAVVVCALAVHAATVRLIFAMARDNSLPCAAILARISKTTRTPVAPAILTGAVAAAILILSVKLPQMIETLCSLAIVWANLAYLMVTFPLLLLRLRGWPVRRVGAELRPRADGLSSRFALGRWGPALNLLAVLWGVFVVVNMSWPREAIYGIDPWGRFSAVLATAGLTAMGVLFYLAVPHRRTGILAEHASLPEVGSDADVTISSLRPVPAE